MENQLLQHLQQVERLSVSGRLARALHHPLKYMQAQWFLKCTYPKTRKGTFKQAETFFGQPMQLLLPAATDIYLTGGKTHSSEIRLARYLIKHLREGQVFMDVGAHFGYFTLLAAQLVGATGKVCAFEAAANTYAILSKNVSTVKQIVPMHRALSDKEEFITFYEFPVLYSEYNSMEIGQFANESWIERNPPEKVEVQAVTLDRITAALPEMPDYIKIDVEGAEDKVIIGGAHFLKAHAPVIIMEFLSEQRLNAPHFKAQASLVAMGYRSHRINNDGELEYIENIADHLSRKRTDSDNIVFVKQQGSK